MKTDERIRDMKLKWVLAAAMVAAIVFPSSSRAQTVVAIGNIGKVEDKAPILWGIGGLSIFTVRNTEGSFTPIMRTEVYDARTVEILCRTQAPRLQSGDVHVMSRGGHDYILVRKFLLIEVRPQDAESEGLSKSELAAKWAHRLGQVLPKVAPYPSAFGV
jgi:hypothetical protein